MTEQIHHQTPLWASPRLSAANGREVWLKMEALQPTGSFKLRGIGLRCQQAVAAGAKLLVSSSGGNAGYAAAWAARSLQVPLTVFVPESTPTLMCERIRRLGAEVIVTGAIWDEAHAAAVAHLSDAGGAYIHPFDHPDIWRGHASMIDEIVQTALRPTEFVVAVGGGGLLCGVVQGLRGQGLERVPVRAVETHGAASYAAACAAGKVVSLPKLTTVAKSLGSRMVATQAVEDFKRHPISVEAVSDGEAVEACLRFLDDHRVLVEPACGAVLALAYQGRLTGEGPVVVVVCGGATTTHAQLQRWARELVET